MAIQLITEAVTKALESGAATGVAATAKTAIGDAYNGFKSLIASKYGDGSKPAKAMEELEQTPDSNGRREVLKEEFTKARVESDPEIASAAQSLLELIRALPQSEQATQIAHGTGIAQASHGGTATATVYAPPNTGKDG